LGGEEPTKGKEAVFEAIGVCTGWNLGLTSDLSWPEAESRIQLGNPRESRSHRGMTGLDPLGLVHNSELFLSQD
jgi:hypothetical protein